MTHDGIIEILQAHRDGKQLEVLATWTASTWVATTVSLKELMEMLVGGKYRVRVASKLTRRHKL